MAPSLDQKMLCAAPRGPDSVSRGRARVEIWLAAGAVAWLTAVFVAPLARSQGWAFAGVLYAAFHQVCHQIPERSFHAFGYPLAVCHRCFGLYLGGALGLAVWPRSTSVREWLLERPRLVPLFVVPLVVDAILIPNTVVTRFATGLLAAFPVALLVWAAADQIFAAHLKSSEEA